MDLINILIDQYTKSISNLEYHLNSNLLRGYNNDVEIKVTEQRIRDFNNMLDDLKRLKQKTDHEMMMIMVKIAQIQTDMMRMELGTVVGEEY